MEKENLQAFEKIVSLFKTDKIVTQKDIDAVLSGVLQLLTQFKSETSNINEDTKKQVEKLLTTVLEKYQTQNADINQAKSEFKDIKNSIKTKFDKSVEEINYLISEFQKMKPKDGVSPDVNEIVALVLEQLNSQEDTDHEMGEMDGCDIIDKINELDYSEENQIDWQRIKNVPNFMEEIRSNASAFGKRNITVISNAVDLDTSARADGYAIVWDATNKRHKYSASGGGGGMSIGGSITSATQGSVLFAGASGVLAQDNANFFFDDSTNRLMVGTNSPAVSISNSINVVNTGLAFYTAIGYGIAGVSGGFYAGYASNGTPASPTAVLTGSTLVALSGRGYDGTSWTSGSQASILLQTSETWTSSARGTNIVFNTTQSGSTTNTGRMVIGNTGTVAVGTTSVQNAMLGVIPTRSSSYFASGGVALTVYDGTFTDTSSTGTVALARANVLGLQTYVASSATTYTNAINFYIAGAPIASTNVTFTNSWALYVASGVSGFGGNVVPITGATYDLGNSTLTWGNIYMGATKKIDFAGDVTITHSTDTLSFAGAATVYTFDNFVAVGTATPTSGRRLTLAQGTMTSTQAGGIDITGDIQGNVGSNGISFALNNTTANQTGYLRLDRTASSVFVGMSLASQSRDGIRIMTNATTPVEVVRIDAGGVLRPQSGIATALTDANSNFYIANASAGGAGTQAEILVLSATAADYRGFMRGSSNITLSAGRVYANFIYGTEAVTEATSGTHPLIANLILKPVAITNGTATTTNGATLYIESGATGTVPTNNYALWVDADITRLDGNLMLGANITDANNLNILGLTSTASAVNYLTLANSATTTSPSLTASGTDTNIDISLIPKGTGIVKGTLHRFMVRLVASDTDQATGTAIGGDYRISNRAITIKAVGSYCDTAGTTGVYTIDINEAGSTILSTKITVDSTEKSSETAATAPVISDASIAADAVITFDVDGVQTTKAKGLVVWIDYVYA